MIRYANRYYTIYNQYNTIFKSVQYNIQINTIKYTNKYDMIYKSVRYHITLICISYRTDSYIVLYWFVYCIILICILYHTDLSIVLYRFVYHIIPIVAQIKLFSDLCDLISLYRQNYNRPACSYFGSCSLFNLIKNLVKKWLVDWLEDKLVGKDR